MGCSSSSSDMLAGGKLCCRYRLAIWTIGTGESCRAADHQPLMNSPNRLAMWRGVAEQKPDLLQALGESVLGRHRGLSPLADLSQ